MTQEDIWDREYRHSKLLTKENKPQADVVRFADFLKKRKFIFNDARLLDLGCGTGRNSFYFAEKGCQVTGLEISKTALHLAQENASFAGLQIEYKKQDIGSVLPYRDQEFDIMLDITSSNSLTEQAREIYFIENSRLLKSGGYFMVKALSKEGDQNAKFLLRNHPGKEKDTYIMPGLGLSERVWSREDFVASYEKYFTILHLEKKTSYSRMNDRVYKRNFWIAYLTKSLSPI